MVHPTLLFTLERRKPRVGRKLITWESRRREKKKIACVFWHDDKEYLGQVSSVGGAATNLPANLREVSQQRVVIQMCRLFDHHCKSTSVIELLHHVSMEVEVLKTSLNSLWIEKSLSLLRRCTQNMEMVQVVFFLIWPILQDADGIRWTADAWRGSYEPF